MLSIVSSALKTLGVWNLSQHCNLIQTPKQFRFQVTCYPLLKNITCGLKNTIFNNLCSFSWQVPSFTSKLIFPSENTAGRIQNCIMPCSHYSRLWKPSSKAMKEAGVGRQAGGGTGSGSQGNNLGSGLPRNKIMHHTQQWTTEKNESKLHFWL